MKISRFFFPVLLAVLLLTGSTSAFGSEQDETEYYIYCLNHSETELERIRYIPDPDGQQQMLQDMMLRINNGEKHGDGQGLLPPEVQISAYSIQDGRLDLEFNSAYTDMPFYREILVRAGIVRTLIQVPGIISIRFLVGQEELKDKDGHPVGAMTLSDFSELSRSEPSYRYDTLTMFFTDREGQKLIPETRNLYYKRNLSRERVLLEQLIKGPMVKGHYPTVPENTSVNKVIIYDRVCYVDLGSAFVEYPLRISPLTSLYSVVNTLIYGGSVDTVQISVNGNEHAVLDGQYSLYTYLEWNAELLEEG